MAARPSRKSLVQAFMRGAASLFDLGFGAARRVKPGTFEDDRKALGGDWERVCRDGYAQKPSSGRTANKRANGS